MANSEVPARNVVSTFTSAGNSSLSPNHSVPHADVLEGVFSSTRNEAVLVEESPLLFISMKNTAPVEEHTRAPPGDTSNGIPEFLSNLSTSTTNVVSDKTLVTTHPSAVEESESSEESSPNQLYAFELRSTSSEPTAATTLSFKPSVTSVTYMNELSSYITSLKKKLQFTATMKSLSVDNCKLVSNHGSVISFRKISAIFEWAMKELHKVSNFVSDDITSLSSQNVNVLRDITCQNQPLPAFIRVKLLRLANPIVYMNNFKSILMHLGKALRSSNHQKQNFSAERRALVALKYIYDDVYRKFTYVSYIKRRIKSTTYSIYLPSVDLNSIISSYKKFDQVLGDSIDLLEMYSNTKFLLMEAGDLWQRRHEVDYLTKFTRRFWVPRAIRENLSRLESPQLQLGAAESLVSYIVDKSLATLDYYEKTGDLPPNASIQPTSGNGKITLL